MKYSKTPYPGQKVNGRTVTKCNDIWVEYTKDDGDGTPYQVMIETWHRIVYQQSL